MFKRNTVISGSFEVNITMSEIVTFDRKENEEFKPNSESVDSITKSKQSCL